MPRSILIRSKEHPYCVFSQTCNDEDFPIPLEEVWNFMKGELDILRVKYELHIEVFILLPTHFYLLCRTPQENLDQVMQLLLRKTSRMISLKSKFSWRRRYRWSLIDSEIYSAEVFRYILQEPIRKGMVEHVEDYFFSTLSASCPYSITWLNQRYDEESLRLIQLGLRRAQFDVSKRKRGKFIPSL